MTFQFLRHLLVLGLLVSAQSIAVASALQNTAVPPQSSSKTKHPLAWCAIDNLTDVEGVDFNPYLRTVALSIRQKWFENMPASIQSGQHGKNIVEFRILTDGKVPEEFLKLASTSESKEFDRASLQGVREAMPFSRLPESFSKPYIVLRVTFYYNLPRT